MLSESLADHLRDVDVAAQAAAFYTNAPPLDIRRAASLPTEGHLRVSHRLRRDAQILPSSLWPPVLASDHVLLWKTPHSHTFQMSLEAELTDTTILKLF